MTTPDILTDAYRMMLRIRAFEEKLLELFRRGELRGTAHLCLGQEAVSAGACMALDDSDLVTSNHRGHGHMIACGADVKKIMAELFGKKTGYSLGRGGSQHIAAHEVGFLGSNGITAGGLPVAAGAGVSLQMKKTGGVCLAFFGDGASAQGAFHEALNLAAVWKLPVIFLCENNQYAMGTPVARTCPTDTLAQRAAGYGMEFATVDGNSFDSVFEAVKAARAKAASGSGPQFIEALTYRAKGHSRSDMCEYRDSQEEERWLALDPIKLLRERLLDAEGISDDELKNIESDVDAQIEDSVDFARESEPLHVSGALHLVYPEPAEIAVPDVSGVLDKAGEISYADAIHAALHRALQDESVILMGEDIAAYRGAFRVTRDLCEIYGCDRVRDTPISENTIVGAGVGAAMTGMRPVVEIMFMDFLYLALDQLANHAAKFSYIFGGQAKVPLTMRTPAGGRRGYGATHSQCLESTLLSVPGLKVYAPYTAQDAYHLLLDAIYDDAPVAFVEHKLLYGKKGSVDPAQKAPPPGKAAVLRPGSDLTIVAHSHMCLLALDASEILQQEGISVEVIDLRTLVPLDMDTVNESACRTQRVMVVEEGVRRGGVGSEIAARLQEECFGYLDAPVLRVGARECPVPTVEHLECEVLPQVADIVVAARSLLEE